jgi:hypothetical protein
MPSVSVDNTVKCKVMINRRERGWLRSKGRDFSQNQGWEWNVHLFTYFPEFRSDDHAV